jgi:hypothetical protein
VSENTPGRHWVTATPGRTACGEGPDAIYCPVFWAKHAECEELRALVAEILAVFGPSGSGMTARVGQVQIAKWGARAGIEAKP